MARRSTYASLSRPRLPFRPMPAALPGTTTCARCGGAGGFRAHKSIHGGECYECLGFGVVPDGAFGPPVLTVERLDDGAWVEVASGGRNGVQDRVAELRQMAREGYATTHPIRVRLRGVVVWLGRFDGDGSPVAALEAA